MTQRMVDVDTTKDGSPTITEIEQQQGASVDIKNEAGVVVETRAQKKARRAQVLARGGANDRLAVEYPADKYHGEWVPFKDGGVEVHRKKALGFWIDTEFATQRALHSDESYEGGSVIGDTVWMMCTREDKDILDEIKQERYDAIHNPKKGKQKEERDFLNQAPGETAPASESNVKTVRRRDIADAINAASNQNI